MLRNVSFIPYCPPILHVPSLISIKFIPKVKSGVTLSPKSVLNLFYVPFGDL